MKKITALVIMLFSLAVFPQNSKNKPIAKKVLLHIVEEAPVYPSCENANGNTARIQCMSKKISEFVNLNFNIQIASKLGLKGVQRIHVVFQIDENGNVIEAKARASHSDLEKEMIRVVNLLPKMKPAMQNSKPVIVPYSFPAVFNAEALLKVTLKTPTIEEKNKGIRTEVPFAIIETVPVYPGCEKALGLHAQKKCMSNKISEFVSRKFNTDLAQKHGLEGRQRINVIFKIDKTGTVVGIRAKSNEEILEQEAIRVIKLLPKMKPGMQKGKVVTVPYAIPIVFEVAKKTKNKDKYSVPSIRDY